MSEQPPPVVKTVLQPPKARVGFRTIAVIIASALFMEQLDATILATALPTIARDFDVSPAYVSIAQTSYLLSLAALIPASGRVADRYGGRRVFLAAIVLFMFGSILCAQAPTLPILVLARLLQGAGGAMMVPVGRLVLLRAVDKRDLVSAMGWMLVPALIGPVLGPPVGGFIVTYLDWRWIFYINLPIGLLGLAMTWIFIPDVREARYEPFDVTGFLLSAVSLACLLFGFETVTRGDAQAAFLAIGLITIGIVSGGLYVFYARRQRQIEPILDLSLMQIPTFRVSMIAGSLSRITQGAQPFLLPLMLQVGFGLSAARSGLLIFSSAVGFAFMKGAAKPLLKRFGFRSALIWNSAISSLLYAICAFIRPGWPHWAIIALLLCCGASMSLQFSAFNTVCYDDIPATRLSSANSFYGTFQQLMLSFGICVGAMALTASRLLFGHARPTLDDFSVAFLLVTAISVLASPVCAAFPRNAGAAMSGHHGGRDR